MEVRFGVGYSSRRADIDNVAMFGFTLDFLRPDFAWCYQILRPDFVWSYPIRAPPLSSSIPDVPRPTPWLIRRFWGYVHKVLIKFSLRYVKWTGSTRETGIYPLPFGVLIKRSEKVRIEEALTTQAARAAGLPAPKIICYGEHADSTYGAISIMMTRMPGQELFEELWEWFSPEEKSTIIAELKTYVDTMRCWVNPWYGGEGICSVAGTSICSVRVPSRNIGPCKNEEDFNKLLMEPAQHSYIRSFSNYEEKLVKTKLAHTVPHKIVFTHGDLLPWNILVSNDGHVTAIIDWEASGWYPEYWEYTTAWRFAKPGMWWFEIVDALSKGRYHGERDGDLAVLYLTSESMAW